MGFYISDCGNYYTTTLCGSSNNLLTPLGSKNLLTPLGLKRKKNVLKIENWWIKIKNKF